MHAIKSEKKLIVWALHIRKCGIQLRKLTSALPVGRRITAATKIEFHVKFTTDAENEYKEDLTISHN